jgi:hypothetical protein
MKGLGFSKEQVDILFKCRVLVVKKIRWVFQHF